MVDLVLVLEGIRKGYKMISPVMGLDLSPNSTGLSIHLVDGSHFTTAIIAKINNPEKFNTSDRIRIEKSILVVDQIISYWEDYDCPEHIFIENYAFGANNVVVQAELGGMVKEALSCREDLPTFHMVGIQGLG